MKRVLSRVAAAAVAVVLLQMLGDLTGRSLLVFPEQTACRLAELMLQRKHKTPQRSPANPIMAV